MTRSKAYLSLWLGFLLIQFGASLFDHKDLSVEEAARATIVYHRKPGAPENVNCGDTTCIFRKQYCAAYNIGDNLFVTSAHCLFGNDGTISEPDQLEVLGAGRTNVKIYRHQDPTIDVAWIKEETSKFGNEALDVSVRGTSECTTYVLKVHNASTNNVHGGYQWTTKNLGHPNMKDVPTSHPGTITFNFQSTVEDEDLFLWCIDFTTKKFSLHYMLFASSDKYTLLNDCHSSLCKKLPDEPITMNPRISETFQAQQITNPTVNPTTNPVTNLATNPSTNPTTTPVISPATNPTTKPVTNPTTRSTERTEKHHSATWAPWYPVVHRTVGCCFATKMATMKQTMLPFQPDTSTMKTTTDQSGKPTLRQQVDS